MATNTSWFNEVNLYRQSKQLNSVILDPTGADKLAEESIDLPDLTEVIFGDVNKWTANLLCFPFKVGTVGLNVLTIRNQAYINIPARTMTDDEVGCYYNLGEYLFEPIADEEVSFFDYEPYSNTSVYLPYYGYADLKAADLIGKYLQFRLRVDFKTGQATYYIGVSNETIPNPTDPIADPEADKDCRIIGVYTFQLGVNVPIGRTNMDDTLRNIAAGAIKTAAIIGTTYAAAKIAPTVTSTTTTHTVTTKTPTAAVKTKRNPKTGRQIRTSTFTTGGYTKDVERTATTTTDRQSSLKEKRVGACIEGAADALASFNVRPDIDKPNNAMADAVGSRSIQVVRKYAKVKPITTSDYGRLNGFPCGVYGVLRDYSGYTEITDIHIEGAGFETATQAELAQLEQTMTQGIIL